VVDYAMEAASVRRAIEMLAAEGLVFTIRARGTFVGPRPD